MCISFATSEKKRTNQVRHFNSWSEHVSNINKYKNQSLNQIDKVRCWPIEKQITKWAKQSYFYIWKRKKTIDHSDHLYCAKWSILSCVFRCIYLCVSDLVRMHSSALTDFTEWLAIDCLLPAYCALRSIKFALSVKCVVVSVARVWSKSDRISIDIHFVYKLIYICIGLPKLNKLHW